MNVTAILVLGTLAAGPSAGPQPEGAQAPPQTPAPATRPAPDPRRQDVQLMEIALTRALQTGARDVAQLLRISEPTSAFVTETGRARGFILEGYGIFFDVDVPGMKQSALWSTQVVQLAQDRERTIAALNTMRPDDPLRPLAVRRLRQIQQMMDAVQAGQVLLPPPSMPAQPAPNAPTQFAPSQVTAPGQVTATAVADPTPPSVMPPVAPFGEMPQIRDPNELYTESVKKALIDAMLGYSKLLKVADNEWLTVAASDSQGPTPGQLDDTSRILISIRGSDLSAFQGGTINRDEILKRVVVKEF